MNALALADGSAQAKTSHNRKQAPDAHNLEHKYAQFSPPTRQGKRHIILANVADHPTRVPRYNSPTSRK